MHTHIRARRLSLSIAAGLLQLAAATPYYCLSPRSRFPYRQYTLLLSTALRTLKYILTFTSRHRRRSCYPIFLQLESSFSSSIAFAHFTSSYSKESTIFHTSHTGGAYSYTQSHQHPLAISRAFRLHNLSTRIDSPLHTIHHGFRRRVNTSSRQPLLYDMLQGCRSGNP